MRTSEVVYSKDLFRFPNKPLFLIDNLVCRSMISDYFGTGFLPPYDAPPQELYDPDRVVRLGIAPRGFACKSSCAEESTDSGLHSNCRMQ
jgi:hypothetical protein